MKRISMSLVVASMTLSIIASMSSTNILRAQGKKTGEQSSSKSLVANIKNENAYSGCGCYFSYPSEEKKRLPKFVFISDDNKYAWMNIDGRDVRLSLKHSSNPKVRNIGSRLTRSYSASGVTVSVVYITTRICAPNDENCEVTDYAATFTVSKGSRRQTIKLKGGCGC